jgi:hypothetical protein
MSAAIDQSAALASIAMLEADLARLKAAFGGMSLAPKAKATGGNPTGVVPPALKAYIDFCTRVTTLFKDTIASAKEAGDEERVQQMACSVTVNKQFCSFLKGQHAYDEWEDEAILEAWSTWTPPEKSKMALAKEAKAASAEASDASSAAESKPASGKGVPRGPMSEEAKAKMLAARRATLAAKAASAPAPAAAPAAPKAAPKKVVTYTLEQLQDFTPFSIEGVEYGLNKRGDVVDDDGGFVGHYNGATKKLNRAAPEPEDWLEVAGEP